MVGVYRDLLSVVVGMSNDILRVAIEVFRGTLRVVVGISSDILTVVMLELEDGEMRAGPLEIRGVEVVT